MQICPIIYALALQYTIGTFSYNTLGFSNKLAGTIHRKGMVNLLRPFIGINIPCIADWCYCRQCDDYSAFLKWVQQRIDSDGFIL